MGTGGGVGLAMQVRVGYELLDAVEGGLRDTGGAGGAGRNQRSEEGLGIRERVNGGAAVTEGPGKGGGGVGKGRRGRRWRVGETLNERFALLGELGVALPPRGVLHNLLEGGDEKDGEAGIGFRGSHSHPIREQR